MSERKPPTLSVEKLPSEWERMPRYLILPLEESFGEFRQAIQAANDHAQARGSHYHFHSEDFLNELLIYLRAAFIDVENLESLLLETQEHFPEEAHLLVPALERFGKSLLRELHLCGAYSSDGYLHYLALPEARWVAADVPVLQREAVSR